MFAAPGLLPPPAPPGVPLPPPPGGGYPPAAIGLTFGPPPDPAFGFPPDVGLPPAALGLLTEYPKQLPEHPTTCPEELKFVLVLCRGSWKRHCGHDRVWVDRRPSVDFLEVHRSFHGKSPPILAGFLFTVVATALRDADVHPNFNWEEEADTRRFPDDARRA